MISVIFEKGSCCSFIWQPEGRRSMTASKLRIDIRGLEKSFGEERVLKGLDLSLSSGNFYCLMAPSGTGKNHSSAAPDGLGGSGPRDHNDPALPRRPPADRRRFPGGPPPGGIYGAPKPPFATGNRYTAEELTGFILRLLPEEALNKPVREFSAGCAARTAILRAILAPSDLVLMDEPFTGLDHEQSFPPSA